MIPGRIFVILVMLYEIPGVISFVLVLIWYLACLMIGIAGRIRSYGVWYLRGIGSMPGLLWGLVYLCLCLLCGGRSFSFLGLVGLLVVCLVVGSFS